MNADTAPTSAPTPSPDRRNPSCTTPRGLTSGRLELSSPGAATTPSAPQRKMWCRNYTEQALRRHHNQSIGTTKKNVVPKLHRTASPSAPQPLHRHHKEKCGAETTQNELSIGTTTTPSAPQRKMWCRNYTERALHRHRNHSIGTANRRRVPAEPMRRRWRPTRVATGSGERHKPAPLLEPQERTQFRRFPGARGGGCQRLRSSARVSLAIPSENCVRTCGWIV